MTAPAPEKCDVCGAAPLELVLYPIAIHYKGSGFYSTDYGKGRSGKKDGDSSGDSSSKGDSSKGDSSSKGESSKSDSSSSSGDSKSSDAKPKPAT
jgi:predicted nucleic acid-binding Zn ribbon protein